MPITEIKTKEQLLDTVLSIIEAGIAFRWEDNAAIVEEFAKNNGFSRETIDEIIEQVEAIEPSPRYYED